MNLLTITAPVAYLRDMMRNILTSMALIAISTAASAQQSAAQTDSLMARAARWRDAANYTEAINLYSQVKTDEASLAIADTYLEMGNVVAALDRAKALQRDEAFALKDDARLIEARCRQRQGYDRAARRIYAKLTRQGHAEAAFYYADMMSQKGHFSIASSLCQTAIAKKPALTPAHLLLAQSEAALGHRYQALLSLMRYLLTASDDGRAQNADLLAQLWRKGWGGLDPLAKRTPEEPYSQQVEAAIDSLIAAIPTSGGSPADLIENIAERTDSLAAFLRATGEENLDFFQVAYADFLIEAHVRGFIRPMVYFFFTSLYHAEVLTWLSENAGYFNEFRLWVEGRTARL